MKRFRILMWCNDTSEVIVEANSKEEAYDKLFHGGIWEETYPNSINQSGEDYSISEI